jgi:hypothetical protein
MDDDKTRFQIDAEKRRERAAVGAEIEELRRLTEARFKAAAEAVAKTPAGLDFLVGLFHLCAYNKVSVVARPDGSVIESATVYNDARRSVYVDLRTKLSPEARAKVEALAEQPVEELK